MLCESLLKIMRIYYEIIMWCIPNNLQLYLLYFAFYFEDSYCRADCKYIINLGCFYLFCRIYKNAVVCRNRDKLLLFKYQPFPLKFVVIKIKISM